MADRWIISNTHDEWLEARRRLVMASETSTIVGLWGDDRLVELAREKRSGERAFEGNLRTEIGKALEPYIASKMQAGDVERLPEGRYIHNDSDAIRVDETGRLGATIDVAQYVGETTQPHGVWDMKTTGCGLAKLPTLAMQMQVNWQMHCMGVRHGGIVALSRHGAFLRAFEVKRDLDMLHRLIGAAMAFRELVDSSASELEIVDTMRAHAWEEQEGNNDVEI